MTFCPRITELFDNNSQINFVSVKSTNKTSSKNKYRTSCTFYEPFF